MRRTFWWPCTARMSHGTCMHIAKERKGALSSGLATVTKAAAAESGRREAYREGTLAARADAVVVLDLRLARNREAFRPRRPLCALSLVLVPCVVQQRVRCRPSKCEGSSRDLSKKLPSPLVASQLVEI